MCFVVEQNLISSLMIVFYIQKIILFLNVYMIKFLIIKMIYIYIYTHTHIYNVYISPISIFINPDHELAHYAALGDWTHNLKVQTLLEN